MTFKKLAPDQIITLCDFPVFNEQILKIYFRIFKKGQGKIVPPCPVLPLSVGLPLMKANTEKAKKYNRRLMLFLAEHPRARYFLLDGSHKTTAAALAGKNIPVVVFRSNKDMQIAKKMLRRGEFISLSVGDTIKGELKTLTKHFSKYKKFETVAEKTRRMISSKILPAHMTNRSK